MPAPELRIGNRTAYFRKAITNPDYNSESVLTRDVFQFAELWLRRHCVSAIPFWRQASSYYAASLTLPPVSAPLTSYYCFLNAVKALLTVKNVAFSRYHGISGRQGATTKRALSNEQISIKQAGIVAALSSFLAEPETQTDHTVKDLLANLPFIHRAFRHTFKSKSELYIPLKNVVYRKHPDKSDVWFTADIFGRFADERSLKTVPSAFEVDRGVTLSDGYRIRSKKRSRWYDRGSNATVKNLAINRLNGLHSKLRLDIAYISAPTDLWYVKRNMSGAVIIRRYGMTMIMAIMHRLSELSRYDPEGLSRYLEGAESWLISEFIQLAPPQFIDEVACEMTSLELRIPGVRNM